MARCNASTTGGQRRAELDVEDGVTVRELLMGLGMDMDEPWNAGLDGTLAAGSGQVARRVAAHRLFAHRGGMSHANGFSFSPGVSTMVKGLANKILRVDLSDRRIWTEEQDDVFYRRYLGGAGIVTYYLLKELQPGVDPLSPGNILVFAPGPVTGTPVPGASRLCVGAKSPLSGGMAKSEAGGFFGYELKRAGFDALVVQGKADQPVYLWVHNGEVEIRDASHLWGQTVLQTQDAIEAELGEKRVRTAMHRCGRRDAWPPSPA